MRIALALLLAGCAAGPPRYAWSNSYMTCRLTAGGLDCTAVNHGDNGIVGATTFCVEPYLVVRQTGTVRGRVTCAPHGIPKGDQIRWLADFGAAPADLCGPDFARCAMFVVADKDNGDPRKIAALDDAIGAVQNVAPEHDFTHPSVRECKDAAWTWRANPELAGINELAAGDAWFVHQCMKMPRPRFDCMRRARTDVALAQCK